MRAQKLSALSLVHGFSTRAGGVSAGAFASLNVSHELGDEPARVEENRRRLARAAGFDRSRLIEMRQLHSDRVIVLSAAGGKASPELRGDALVALDARWVLGVRTADCLAVLLADSKRRAVAAVHAGWRGTLAGIVSRAVEALDRCGCARRDLVAALGPCIRACCFEVGPDVAERFEGECGPGVVRYDERGRRFVDLAEANRRRLVAAGLPPASIEDLGLCTACRPDLFFSHRRDRGRTGRQLAFIALAPPDERPGAPAGI
ncbi:MAG: peptidoglycan editing factor PgeF [Myxococcales bacterium]|nr:peptidoglycan editing factor PgeF [Myxococcales bacterium]